MPGEPHPLHASLYDMDQQGESSPAWTGSSPGSSPGFSEWMTAVSPGRTLHVRVGAGKDSSRHQYLNLSPAEGMASEPVKVRLDARTGHWIINNSGHSNTLRIQQYGLMPVILPPRGAMPLVGEHAAVWIPVGPAPSVPSAPSQSGKEGESFRLLMLSATPPAVEKGKTQPITFPRHWPSDAAQEALVAYFGENLSWPPLPSPHIRQKEEVADIAQENGLAKTDTWARNRRDALTSKDGFFARTGWYPCRGGARQTPANHLAVFHRLVELQTITLSRVRNWANLHDVVPYVSIDERLLPPSRPH